MKKIIGIFIFVLVFFFNYSHATINNYHQGQIVSGFIELSKKIKVKIPEGDWEVIDRWNWSGFGARFTTISLGRIENNEIMEGMDIGFSNIAGVYVRALDQALIEAMFKDKHDGCYERPEYFILELYRKGNTHNCFKVRHIDVMKELHNPDDKFHNYSAPLKQWLRDNSDVKIPNIMLGSFHSYFSRMTGGYWVMLSYSANPKIIDGPLDIFLTEDTSEYHKQNINRFPEHQKAMNKWLSISSKRHKEFEILHKARSNHKLKLEKYILN